VEDLVNGNAFRWSECATIQLARPNGTRLDRLLAAAADRVLRQLVIGIFCDVLAEIWATRDLLPVTARPAVLHIKEHQAKKIACEQLPLPAQLNVDADKLAVDHMANHPNTDCTVVPVLPTSGVQLHLPAGTITCNMKKEVSMARTTEPMKQHMIKKHNCDKETFLDIDWEAHRRGANRHHKQRTTLNKHLGNILPVGKVVSRCDPVKCRSDCPTCSTGDGT